MPTHCTAPEIGNAPVADLIAGVVNRYTGVRLAAPALVQIEFNARRRMRDWIDLRRPRTRPVAPPPSPATTHGFRLDKRHQQRCQYPRHPHTSGKTPNLHHECVIIITGRINKCRPAPTRWTCQVPKTIDAVPYAPNIYA